MEELGKKESLLLTQLGLRNHKITVWWAWGSPGIGLSIRGAIGIGCAI